jgi:hypothetical protein
MQDAVGIQVGQEREKSDTTGMTLQRTHLNRTVKEQAPWKQTSSGKKHLYIAQVTRDQVSDIRELDFHSNALATTTTTTTTTRRTLAGSKDSVMNLTDARSCEWYTVEGYKVIGPCFA